MNGLVLCLDAANIKSYSGIGTTWTDISTNNNNGTLTNGPTYSTSNGGCFVFNGTNNYVDLGYILQYQGDFTAECVAKVNTASPAIFECGSVTPIMTNNDWGWNILMNDSGKVRWEIYDGNQNMGLIQSSIGTFGDWLHCVGYKKGIEVGFYVNGISQGTGSLVVNSIYYSGPPFSLGGNFTCGSGRYFMDGRIALARVYNRALSSTEITQNFNALKGRFGI